MVPLSVLRQAEQAARHIPRGWIWLTAAVATWALAVLGYSLIAIGLAAVWGMLL